ncbi:MAG: efflux RND transporter periplasmic adaptor subunit [Rikenellaceae bacterium]|nr:efflux RND transporter periplasmic adaptor subunit [Rikenellaceae bacterium]
MKKISFIAPVIFMAAFAMTGCIKKKTVEVEEEYRAPVKTQYAYYEEIDNTQEFTSTIHGYKENNIAPSLSSVRIDNIFVDVGQNVSRGQLLVKMDPTNFNQSNIQLLNLEADYNRIKAVYEAGGISKQELDQIETSLAVQKEQTDNLKVNIELRSPIDGVVTERNYDPGDLYSGAPILQVMQINTLKVTVAISEQYFPYVSMNMPTEIRVDMYPDKVFEGKVSLIYPAIDAATRTFNVEITIPNKDRLLRPGMFSRTILHFGKMPALMVEDIAVQKQVGSNDKYLFIVNDGAAERREVTTGRQIGNKIQILTGLDNGDEVITTGISRLDTGTPVEIIND